MVTDEFLFFAAAMLVLVAFGLHCVCEACAGSGGARRRAGQRQRLL